MSFIFEAKKLDDDMGLGWEEPDVTTPSGLQIVRTGQKRFQR